MFACPLRASSFSPVVSCRGASEGGVGPKRSRRTHREQRRLGEEEGLKRRLRRAASSIRFAHRRRRRRSIGEDDDYYYYDLMSNDDDETTRSARRTTSEKKSRRKMCAMAASSFAALHSILPHVLFAKRSDDAAWAFTKPPPGFDLYVDTIDGYEFLRPSAWVEVKGSGNDIFYRNPGNVEENCFVAISSPSSNVYTSVRDVGTPEETARKILKQTLIELTSTRLGIVRESEVLDAKEDVDKDGNVFYDITLRIKSYAAKNQYGLTPEDRPQTLEWDRTFYSRLGTENGRLYELRMQSPSEEFEESKEQYLVGMGKSFRPFEVDAPPPSVGKQLGLNFI